MLILLSLWALTKLFFHLLVLEHHINVTVKETFLQQTDFFADSAKKFWDFFAENLRIKGILIVLGYFYKWFSATNLMFLYAFGVS